MVMRATDLIITSALVAAMMSVIPGFIPDIHAARPEQRASETAAVRKFEADSSVVNRDHKGDRLPLASKSVQPLDAARPAESIMPRRVPLGCEPAFSPIVQPSRARFFGRCAT
jgi:hypothetical protein